MLFAFVESVFGIEIRQVDNQGVWHPEWEDSIPSMLLISSSQAAKEIVQAISQWKKEKAIANYSKVIIFLKRHLPGLVIMDNI